MNILYLISYAGRAGTEKYVENLIRTYTARGDTCFLVYMDGGELAERVKALECETHKIDLRALRIFGAARDIARLCREKGIDIIHAQYPRENVIAVLSRLWRKKTRVVFTSHLSVRQNAAWRTVNRIITPHNAACIAVCTEGAALLRENCVSAGKIHVIFNGIEARALPLRENIIRREFALPDDCFIFLTLARYAPEKGLSFLLDSLAVLKARTPRRFVCLIAGDGELFDAVGNEIAEKGLSKNVIRAGYRTDAEHLLRSADAYVSSSLSEAMSFAALEAMGCGLPLVMTDVGAGADLAHCCGFCVAPGDIEAMAESLQILMENNALRREYGENAHRRAVTEFSLADRTEELHVLYEKCLENHGKPS